MSTLRAVLFCAVLVHLSALPLSLNSPAVSPVRVRANILVAGPRVGRYTNIKVGADGLPLATANDEVHGGAAIVHCTDPACSNFTSTVLDSSKDSNNARFIDLLMSPTDGLPVMVFEHDEEGTRVVKCKDVACSAWSINSVSERASHPSMAFTREGLPVVAYGDTLSGGVFVALCHDHACSGARHVEVEKGMKNGRYPGIDVNADNVPVLSYYDGSLSSPCLKFSSCGTPDCSNITTTIVDQSSTDVGTYNFMRIGSDGLPFMMYADSTNGLLKVAHCADAVCSRAALTTVDTIGKAPYGVFPEWDISPYTTFPVLSYIDQSDAKRSALKLLQCKSLTCDDWLVQTLATGTEGYGRDSSIAFAPVDVDARVYTMYVSFLDYNGGTEKNTRVLVLDGDV